MEETDRKRALCLVLRMGASKLQGPDRETGTGPAFGGKREQLE